jgi:tetratricopeptide (TPR) repeat protein
VLNNLGWAYVGLEQWDKAIPFFQEALKVQPTFDLARNNLSYAQEQFRKKKTP